jgi:hypothetical protein
LIDGQEKQQAVGFFQPVVELGGQLRQPRIAAFGQPPPPKSWVRNGSRLFWTERDAASGKGASWASPASIEGKSSADASEEEMALK